MSPLSPRECFNLLAPIINIQKDRLLIEKGGSKRSKGQQIHFALNRLCLAIIEKNPQGIPLFEIYPLPEKIEKRELAKIDLTTIDQMLDAEISIWKGEIEPSTEHGMDFNGRRAGHYRQISLRTALNISRHNIFNLGDGSWGPIRGTSKALEEVEKELEMIQKTQKI